MDLLVLITLFLFGAISASFVGVLVARLNTGQSIADGRSRCDACGAPLSLRALVPILSYLASRGRAHCCGASISGLAPFTELLLGALFVLAYLTVGMSLALPSMLISLALLLALVLYDLAHHILPTVLLTPFILMTSATGFLMSPSPAAFLDTLVIALFIALFLLCIHMFSRGRAMGFADAPFAFGLALLVGPAAVPGFIFSFWIGAAIGIGVLLKRPRGSRMGVEVPFAPFLALGFLFAYFTQWNPFIFTAVLSSR